MRRRDDPRDGRWRLRGSTTGESQSGDDERDMFHAYYGARECMVPVSDVSSCYGMAGCSWESHQLEQ